MLVLLIIIIVLTVIALLPLGVDGGYKNGKFELHLKIGLISFGIPPKKKITKKPKMPKKKQKTKQIDEETEPEEKKPFNLGELFDIIKLALKALGRFRRKLTIEYMRVHYTFASDDPFKTAFGFGMANATMGAIIPLLDGAFKIKERDFGVQTDFLIEKPIIDVWLTASIRIWEIVYIAAAFGIDYLKLKIRQKRQSRSKERNESNGQTSDR